MRARPLRSVLLLRKRALDEARAELGRALAIEEGARRSSEALARLAMAWARRRVEAGRRLGLAPSRAGALEAASSFCDRLRGDARSIETTLGASESLLREATEGVEHSRELLAAAGRAVHQIERHRELWDLALRRERERRIESDAEEVVSARATER